MECLIVSKKVEITDNVHLYLPLLKTAKTPLERNEHLVIFNE
jgi:hypothetical protein